ncbi:hypothetical protein [Runella aurantiaca]|uniref:Uncharacterized protein n=1 Tax=Runella aurantiaca TaxID=2282308 RepID=A0A369I591_9BACT|nr:hypothetical protein [Runella aurantiaca]RDB03425.1 hypothetical protein DVG78_24075 [Runella aurantiaca]
MKKQTLTCLFCAVTCITNAFGQEFIPGFDSFSHSKPAYVHLGDGTVMEGEIDDIDRKKGLIEAIAMRSKSGKKAQLFPDDIKIMYLPATAMTKLDNRITTMTNVRKLQNADVNMETINKGYAYFEKSVVVLKKETLTLLLQVVNPSFCQKIKVYHDAYAGQSASLGVGSMTVAGGLDKSYFVKVGNQPAFKLKKADYEEEFPNIFANCPAFSRKYASKKDRVWRDFAKHVAEYTELCKN